MKVDDVKKLHQKKYRTEFGYFLVEGEHLVLELEKAAVHNPLLRNCKLLVTENYQNWPSNFFKQLLSSKQMAQISDTQSPPGIIAIVPILPPLVPTTLALNERAIYLHEIQDPGNLGTILRTLAWFGNFRCLLSPGAVDPYNPKVVRASMGAIFHVPIELDVPLATLTKRFHNIACLDLRGQSLATPAFKNQECYLFGNEARGLPTEMLAANMQIFTIPGGDLIDSLNLAAAVNICAYELTR